MVFTLRFLCVFMMTMLGATTFAQSDNGCKPPIERALRHDRIDREQKNALKADGKADQVFYAGDNEDINYFITRAFTEKIDRLQCSIEKDTSLGHNEKVKYLAGMENILKNFLVLYRKRQFNASQFPKEMDAFEAAIARDKNGQSIESIVESNPYDVGFLLISSQSFDRNPGFRVSKNILLKKYCLLNPDKIFITLKANPDVPFRDSLIKIAGYKFPKLLYDYASADNKLGYAIRSIDDPFIQAISRIAKSGGSGQILFPFLDNVIAGTMTYDEINAVKNDGVKYYKLLVQTRLDYVNRSLNGEKILSMGVLDTMLHNKGRDIFIKEINGLHEEPDPVRFRILQQLTAQELYYLVIAGETELYTSSYTKGVYPLMMQKIGNDGDSLLYTVNFDRFKKFIKMAAGYNTLSDFLSTFDDKGKAHVLMTAFVNNLEKSGGLEDGVDVADSYASIAETLKPLAAEMLNNVKMNYDRNVEMGNKRGMVIYDLLYKLFLSADSTSGVNLSKEFGIPPVYNINYQQLLADTSNKVVMQVFFYGDEDGRNNYRKFIPQFSPSGWKKIEDTKYWVAYASTKGKPILVYANKPLDEESGEVDRAQEGLVNYLEEKDLQPTIVIHRGHSYYAPYTISQIPSTAKIVFLGSCGGYHLIHSVLKNAPDAHIISSKQIGKEVINRPFIELVNEKLRTGSDIDWIPFWKEFRSRAGTVEGFEDYIPPHKNLGAIFIKAYNIAMGDEGVAQL